MSAALKSIDPFIVQLCKEYKKKKLHKICLKNLIKNNIAQYLKVINSQLYIIYISSFPKNVSKECKKEKSKNKHNLGILYEAIKEEEKQGKNNLYMLAFKVTFKDILLAFVNDEQIIFTKDENGEEFIFILKDFKTFNDFSKEENYSKEESELIREDIIRLINGEIKIRKSRK